MTLKLEEIKALVDAAKLPEGMTFGRYLPETFDVFDRYDIPVARFFEPVGKARADLFAKLPAVLTTLITALERAEEDVEQWRAIAEAKCDEAATNEIPNLGDVLSIDGVFARDSAVRNAD